jgi:hypothetical protein
MDSVPLSWLSTNLRLVAEARRQSANSLFPPRRFSYALEPPFSVVSSIIILNCGVAQKETIYTLVRLFKGQVLAHPSDCIVKSQ